MNKSLIGIFVFSFIFISACIALVVWYSWDRPSGHALILQDANNLSFKGRVDSLYYDRRNHNAKMAVLSDGYLYGIWEDWQNEIDRGDSLFKSKGSLRVEVFKSNGKIVILDYKKMVENLR